MSLYSGHNNRIVVVQSENRDSGTDTDFVYNLQLPTNDFTHVALHQFSCPRSYYDVDQYTNQFYLTEGTTTVTVSLSVGWYNVNTFATELAYEITKVSPNGWVYTVSYPGFNVVNTNKYTFTVTGTGAGTTPPSLTFQTEDCWVQCGFNASSVNTFSRLTANTASLVSTNCINISYINRLYLTSNICSEEQNQLLQVILIAGNYQPGSYIYYEDLLVDTNARKFTNPKDNVFRFTLFDQYGNIILLNGLNLVFSLLFYKKDNINDVHREHITLQQLESLKNSL